MQSSRFPSVCTRFFLSWLLGSLALVVAGCGSQADQPQNVSADTWATVDGRAITREEVEKVFRRSPEAASPGSPEEAMTRKLSILNEMILQNILLEKARTLNIQVTDAELDAAYAERKKNMADTTFEEELKKRNLTAVDLRENLRRELITNKLIEQLLRHQLAPQRFPHVGDTEVPLLQLSLECRIVHVLLALGVGGLELRGWHFDLQGAGLRQQDVLQDHFVEDAQLERHRLLGRRRRSRFRRTSKDLLDLLARNRASVDGGPGVGRDVLRLVSLRAAPGDDEGQAAEQPDHEKTGRGGRDTGTLHA